MALAGRIAGFSGAEDIVQETFARAWERAPLWRRSESGSDDETDRPSYAAWLSRVASNLALDQMRRRPTMPIEAAAEVPDKQAGPEGVVMGNERQARIRAAIADLPDRQRVALSMTYDAELRNTEAAQAMGITVGAFELLLVRARRRLRTVLSEEAQS